GFQPLRQQAHLTGRLPLNLLFQQNRPEADVVSRLLSAKSRRHFINAPLILLCENFQSRKWPCL
ncbi:hypothetical protein, partial [Stutzerimonas stutzeri]|uniref:hypothetical protein n=1 Tax=Stutzerimonas stutzeri TaxID=316 RepID=UPI001C8C92E1